MTAASVGLSAQGQTQYSALGIAATNSVSGNTETTATTSTLTATAGGVSLSATDTVGAAAEASPQSIDLDTLTSSLSLAPALAWNNLNRTVQSSLSGSTVSATGGDVSVTARKADLAGAKTHATSVSASKTPDTSHSVSIGGTFSANTLLGSVIASIDTSTVTTHGTGSVNLNAQDDSAADSRAELSATSSPGSVSFDSLGIAAGPSIAFNSIGWSFGNFALETVNTLLDTQFGDSEQPVIAQASITGSSVTAAGSVTLTALSQAQLNATVSNAASTISSSLYGARGGSASAILAASRVSSKAKAFIDNSTAASGSTVTAAGGVSLDAEDNSGIYSNSKIVASTITTDDGGVSVLTAGVNELVPATYDTTPDSGLATKIRPCSSGTRFGWRSTTTRSRARPGGLYVHGYGGYRGEHGSGLHRLYQRGVLEAGP